MQILDPLKLRKKYASKKDSHIAIYRVLGFFIIGIVLFRVISSQHLESGYGCPYPSSKAYDFSDGVFSGRVLEQFTPKNFPSDDSVGLSVISVTKSWKGVTEPVAYVLSKPLLLFCQSCTPKKPLEFLEQDKEYLFFTKRSGNGTFYVDLCSRTTPIESAKADVDELTQHRPLIWPKKK